jgi:hypothetical protein
MNSLVENTFNPINFLKNFEGENFDDCIVTINFGTNLEFKYINFQNINLTKSEITTYDIFNFNMFFIVSKLSDYFKEINISLGYQVPNKNELIIKDVDHTIKHDVLISFNKEEKYFECGFNFIKKTFFVDGYKNISSHVNLDYYKYFDEDVDNINIFMEDCIYRLLIIICSLIDDEYKLAEILFIKSNRDLSDLKDQIEIFKKIINGKKNNFIDFKIIFSQLMPINPDNGLDMEYDEFMKYIEDNIFDGVKLNLDDKDLLSWNDFELIILGLDKNISLNINYYKKIYTQAINTLLLSLKTINELIQQINKTKKYIPQYINQLLSKDIINFADEKLLDDIYEQLLDYFEE